MTNAVAIQMGLFAWRKTGKLDLAAFFIRYFSWFYLLMAVSSVKVAMFLKNAGSSFALNKCWTVDVFARVFLKLAEPIDSWPARKQQTTTDCRVRDVCPGWFYVRKSTPGTCGNPWFFLPVKLLVVSSKTLRSHS